MDKKPAPTSSNRTQILGVLTAVFGVGWLVARTAYPEPAWASWVVFGAFVACLAAIAWNARRSVSRRAALFGLNSMTTVLLILAILGVLNFLAVKFPKKIDVTRGKVNTLSDQTQKVFKGLDQPVRLVYWSKMEEREELRPLLENLRALSTKVEVEYADPVRELARANRERIKEKTLQIYVGGREQKVQGADEEKITNAVIKLSKNASPVVCALGDHGEKDLDSNQPEGYGIVKATLEDQSYQTKKVSIAQSGKVPAECAAVVVIGPARSFFDAEIKALREYLAAGGSAVVALDPGMKGAPDPSPELTKLLAEWGVVSDAQVVMDPYAQVQGLGPSVPVVPTFSKDVSITRELQGGAVFPLTRPIRIAKDLRPGLKVSWLAQTTPNSWGETDFAAIAKGRTQFDEGKDARGPHYVAVAVDAKPEASTAGAKNTRIAVFGTSLVAANQWTRLGNNLDFFANAVTWVLDDESLISIRRNEDEAGVIQLSAVQAGLIRLVTVLLIPLLMIVIGIVVWVRRKKL